MSFATAGIVAIVFGALASCERADMGDAPAGTEGWLTGNTQEKFHAVADQFGGFSQTMTEVGYRYGELYWAGEDENWGFAQYQLEHIAEAMEAGFQRRPAHKPSGEMFMNHALPAVAQAIEQQDAAAFREQFQRLSMHCNACHTLEEVGFIQVNIPTQRVNPWGAP